jgi:hypothetical protein
VGRKGRGTGGASGRGGVMVRFGVRVSVKPLTWGYLLRPV